MRKKKKDSRYVQMDLWAHFRELAATYEQSSPSSADVEPGERLTTRRPARRPNERAQFTLLRNWLLQDYMAAYCRSLAATRIFRRCYWIDALGLDARAAASSEIESEPTVSNASSGNGKNSKNKKARRPVPPALQPLAALSDELAREPKPITLYGLALAAGSSKRGEQHPAPSILDARPARNGATDKTTTISIPREGGIIAASWLEIAPALLQEIEQAPAFFLLNPLGATLFSAEHLAPLYTRAVPTELCLLLPHKQIGAHLQAALTRPDQATTLSKLLRTDRWKTLPTAPEAQAQAAQGFVELLIASLQRHFQYPVQPLRFPLLVGPANVEDAPYALLFATRRPDSLYCMNDAVSRYQRRVEEASYRGVLGEEWFAEQQQARYQAALQRLTERIRQQVQAQRRARWPDLRHHLLLAHFGQFPLQDYDASIQQLLLNREIYCAWRQPAPTAAEERIPGNDDTLIWR